MNGAKQYTHTSIHTHTHTDTQFLIREVASEINWNGSTVKKGQLYFAACPLCIDLVIPDLFSEQTISVISLMCVLGAERGGGS